MFLIYDFGFGIFDVNVKLTKPVTLAAQTEPAAALTRSDLAGGRCGRYTVGGCREQSRGGYNVNSTEPGTLAAQSALAAAWECAKAAASEV